MILNLRITGLSTLSLLYIYIVLGLFCLKVLIGFVRHTKLIFHLIHINIKTGASDHAS